jgi:hypothetical protein
VKCPICPTFIHPNGYLRHIGRTHPYHLETFRKRGAESTHPRKVIFYIIVFNVRISLLLKKSPFSLLSSSSSSSSISSSSSSSSSTLFDLTYEIVTCI